MAMLVLNDVFSKTWNLPSDRLAAGEFWPGAIATVKSRRPDFLFLAEVYWGMEPRLQSQGFDHTYDKTWYDCVIRREATLLEEHLRRHGANPRMTRFLENHDEPPIASLLAPEEHKIRLRSLLAQPCMRLFHAPQLLGKRKKTPIQLARALPEAPDAEIEALYKESLLVFSVPFSAREAPRESRHFLRGGGFIAEN